MSNAHEPGREADEQVTSPPCERLDWDSTFFGLAIARAKASTFAADDWPAVREWCVQQRIACLYVLAKSGDSTTTRTLEEAGAHLVDVRVTLTGMLSRGAIEPQASVRPAGETDISTLRDIAGRAHADTRFFADGRFDESRCRELYRTWIEKSCRGWSDQVLVAERDARPVGYISLHRGPANEGRIGLVGVAPEWRERGVGRALVQDGLRWLADQGMTKASVPTQGGNVASQRLYQSVGLRTADIAIWYHCWF